MQAKTTGIILHQVKHTDSSSIVTIYTREFGRVAYMVRGANKKKSACRAALMQPLSIVEMNVTHHPKKEIQNIRDMRIAIPFTQIPFDPVKNGIALFITEVLYKTLKHAVSDEELFCFIESSICELDLCQKGVGNFHLVFMAGLAKRLGFAPNVEHVENPRYFDMVNGVFEVQKPLHFHFLEADSALLFKDIMCVDYDFLHTLSITRKKRTEALYSLVDYFKIHLPEFHSLKSISVLQELWQ